jgi:hypothetical protein
LVQNLRIKLSKAEAQLAALKEAQATKQNAKASKAEAQLAALKEAQATKQNAKVECSTVDDTSLSIGNRVELSWDRHWRYGTSKKGMPKTDMEGTIGTVEKVSECFVWVRVDGHKELKQKRKHNVTRLGRI